MHATQQRRSSVERSGAGHHRSSSIRRQGSTSSIRGTSRDGRRGSNSGAPSLTASSLSQHSRAYPRSAMPSSGHQSPSGRSINSFASRPAAHRPGQAPAVRSEDMIERMQSKERLQKVTKETLQRAVRGFPLRLLDARTLGFSSARFQLQKRLTVMAVTPLVDTAAPQPPTVHYDLKDIVDMYQQADLAEQFPSLNPHHAACCVAIAFETRGYTEEPATHVAQQGGGETVVFCLEDQEAARRFFLAIKITRLSVERSAKKGAPLPVADAPKPLALANAPWPGAAPAAATGVVRSSQSFQPALGQLTEEEEDAMAITGSVNLCPEDEDDEGSKQLPCAMSANPKHHPARMVTAPQTQLAVRRASQSGDVADSIASLAVNAYVERRCTPPASPFLPHATRRASMEGTPVDPLPRQPAVAHGGRVPHAALQPQVVRDTRLSYAPQVAPPARAHHRARSPSVSMPSEDERDPAPRRHLQPAVVSAKAQQQTSAQTAELYKQQQQVAQLQAYHQQRFLTRGMAPPVVDKETREREQREEKERRLSKFEPHQEAPQEAMLRQARQAARAMLAGGRFQ